MRFDKWLKICWIGLGILLVLILPLMFVSIITLHDLVGSNPFANMWFLLTFVLAMFAGIISFAIAIMSLIEIITSNQTTSYKILWILVVLLIGLLGTLIYYFAGRKDLKK